MFSSPLASLSSLLLMWRVPTCRLSELIEVLELVFVAVEDDVC